MDDKELRRLKRRELLEILVELAEENESLNQENEALRNKLNDRNICLNEAGSIAEAAININKVFEAAQSAADQYLENIKKLSLEGQKNLKQQSGNEEINQDGGSVDEEGTA